MKDVGVLLEVTNLQSNTLDDNMDVSQKANEDMDLGKSASKKLCYPHVVDMQTGHDGGEMAMREAWKRC